MLFLDNSYCYLLFVESGRILFTTYKRLSIDVYNVFVFSSLCGIIPTFVGVFVPNPFTMKSLKDFFYGRIAMSFLK